MSLQWCPTGFGEPYRPEDPREWSRSEWPMGVVRAFGPSAEYPFGDYPSWFSRTPSLLWSDWAWIG